MDKNKEIKNIERIPELEEKYSVTFKKVYAVCEFSIDSWDIQIFGEIESTKGNLIDNDLTIEAIIYDSKERVIGNNSNYVYADEFFITQPLNMYIRTLEEPVKIKLYPRL